MIHPLLCDECQSVVSWVRERGKGTYAAIVGTTKINNPLACSSMYARGSSTLHLSVSVSKSSS